MDKKKIAEVFETLNDDQKIAVGELLQGALEGDESMKHSDIDQSEILSAGKRMGSLKDAVLTHSQGYGISNINELFPEAKNLNNPPTFLNNNVAWVNKVLSSTHKSPFSRIKSMFADITGDSIRAKGYVKGSLKEEDVFGLLKRTTGPTTVYKKQKLDRDDIIDITDFNVVAWIKSEMKLKLDEELARAILIGDGRLSSDNDHIDQECIRPVFNDSDLYTIKAAIDTEIPNKYKSFIRTAVKIRKDYKGSGEPTLYTTEDVVSEMLLLEDSNGRAIYGSVQALCNILRVKEIVTIPHMEGLVREVESDANTHNVMGIIVNLSDYNVGSDRGGEISMFDDFDIDYNQQKYLIETRRSGALTVPYSAIVIEDVVAPAPVQEPTGVNDESVE